MARRRRRRLFIAAANRRTKHGVFPPGFFLQGADAIARGVRARSPSRGVAVRRITFYINRAGRNLSPGRRAVLERAKRLIQGAGGGYTYALQE